MLLDTTIEDVEELGAELGVPDDEWTVEDLYEADGMLDDDDDED